MDLSWKGLSVFPSHFSYKGHHHQFSEIQAISYLRKATKVSVNFVPSGTDHASYLEVDLVGEEKIRIAHTGSFTKFPSSSSEDKADHITAIYQVLAENTIAQRLARYGTRAATDGYFFYDNKKFHPDGTVEDGKLKLCLLDKPLQREPFLVVVPGSPPDSTWERLRQFWSAPYDIAVKTVTDSDCFFHILREVYEIRWGEFEGRLYGMPAETWERIPADKRPRVLY